MQNVWRMDLSIKERIAQCTMKHAWELCILQNGVHFSPRVCVRDVCHNKYIKPVFVLNEPYKARHQRRLSIDMTWGWGCMFACDPTAANMCWHLCLVLRNVITAGAKKIEVCVPHWKYWYRRTWTYSNVSVPIWFQLRAHSSRVYRV